MATILALPKLFDDVNARFVAEGTGVPNLFGWRKSAQQLATGKRIVWIPGDTRGSLGAMLPARNPGRNPRPIATLEELFTVEISSNDPTQLEDERAQYQATRELYDAWYRAVYLAARGTFRVLSDEWIVDKKERRFGAAIRVVCAVQAEIPDAPPATAPVDTGAVIDVIEYAVDEQFTAP